MEKAKNGTGESEEDNEGKETMITFTGCDPQLRFKGLDLRRGREKRCTEEKKNIFSLSFHFGICKF